MVSDYKVIPMWFWAAVAVVLGMIFANACMGQQARPTYNPFSKSGFNNNQQFFGQRPNYGFNNNQQFFGQRPSNNFNNGFNNNFNNGFNNNQQQGNNQTNNPQLFTRRYHLNNGYLYGRPTLYFDAKSGKMQPWIRKNLR